MSVVDELRNLEQDHGRAARTGLMFARIQLLQAGRLESEVTGLRIGRTTYTRRTGETLDELEERANPGGSWRALPVPLLPTETQAMQPEQWEQSVALQAQLAEKGLE